jgi:hypothetical protein
MEEEVQFDDLVAYTLRIELLNGRVLIYRIDAENRQYLLNKLQMNAEGAEENEKIEFLWFETFFNRHVIINVKEVGRITFCFDYLAHIEDAKAYYDNFEVVEKDTSLISKETEEGESRMYVLEEAFLPQAIIYLKGIKSEDNYIPNPQLFYSLDNGCLGIFQLELDGEVPLRQFINFVDDDGEECFIPLNQVMVMEFDGGLFYSDDEFGEDIDLDEDSDEQDNAG